MKTILLIDNNKDMHQDICEIIPLSRFKIFTAKNGKEGVELAEKNKPDIILCDSKLPVHDGCGVLHLLGKNPETAHIPFIFLTRNTERSDLPKGMGMGADDCITKPFDAIELLNTIESRLNKSKLTEKAYSKNKDKLNEIVTNVNGMEDLKKLATQREVRLYSRKADIYKERTYPRGIYLVVKGKVKTYKIHEQGKEFIIGLHKEGNFFGYTALLDETEYTDSATALEDAEICLIPKEDFFSLFYKNSEISHKFIKMLADNLREKEEQLLNLAYNSIRKRVADALLTFCNRYKKEEEQQFSMNISREDLANLVGSAPETTVRTLSDFKEEGLIDIKVKGGTITIAQYDKLAQMRN